MNEFYSIFVLLYITFAPLGGPMQETVSIAGIYKTGQECVDKREDFMSREKHPGGKYGCVQAVHPEDEARMEREYMRRSEGSHGRES